MPDHPLGGPLPRTRAGEVGGRLRVMILSGDIPPGTHLRQAEVARQFGVSTTPVREAFVALAREGLVRQDAHRGVVVFSPSITELAEIYEIRAALESVATELAAPRLSPDRLEAIASVADRMRHADARQCIELNRELHSLIYAAADRPRLTELIEALRDAASSYISLSVPRWDQSYRDQVQAEHDEIVAALTTGTPADAGRAVRRHLEHSARHLSSFIESLAPADGLAPPV